MSLTWGIGADVRPTGHQLLCLGQHSSELRQPLSFQPDERAEGAIQLRGQRAAGQEDLQGAVRLHLQASVLSGGSTPTACPPAAWGGGQEDPQQLCYSTAGKIWYR